MILTSPVSLSFQSTPTQISKFCSRMSTSTKNISLTLSCILLFLIITTRYSNSYTLPQGRSYEDTKNGVVSLINCYRGCHGVSALTRDTQIESKQSDPYAIQLGNSGQLHHSHSQYGENLYAGEESAATCVNMWYFECQGSYTYGSSGGGLGCGHFTQLVWKGSQRIGVGIAPMASYGVVVVTNFDAAGNFGGQYAQNVLRPDDSCVAKCKAGSTGTGSGGSGDGEGGSGSGGNGDSNSGNGGSGGSGGGNGNNGNGGNGNNGNGGNGNNGNGGNGNNGNWGNGNNGNGGNGNNGNWGNGNGNHNGNGNNGGSNWGNGNNDNNGGGGHHHNRE